MVAHASKSSRIFCVLILIINSVAADESHKLVNTILDAVDSGLDFVTREYEHMNLDAIIGTRMVEGQLHVLRQALKDHPEYIVPSGITERLEASELKARRASELGLPVVENEEPHYFHRIGNILRDGFWALDYPSRDVNMSLAVRPEVTGEAMHEGESDDCLVEIFGTGEENQGETCRISRECWTVMTTPGFRGYSLSHQLFYFQIGQQFGCFEGAILKPIDDLNARTCASMYGEALTIAQNNFPMRRRDLFMELPALCGMMGYRQFFHDDWLALILSWQWDSGCWGDKEPIEEIEKEIRPSERFKREERQIPGGCLFHKTAVALGALVQYIRFVIEFEQSAML